MIFQKIYVLTTDTCIITDTVINAYSTI